MRSLKPVEEELSFIHACSLLFDVWQQAALAQLRRLQDGQAGQARVTERLAALAVPLMPPSSARLPWACGEAVGGRGSLMVVVTSDDGLVGPLHHDVVRAALSHAAEPSRWIAVGSRGHRLLEEEGVRLNRWAFPSEAELESAADAIVSEWMEMLTRQPTESAWLVYPELVTMTVQRPSALRLLPWPVPPLAMPDALVIEPSASRAAEELGRLWLTHHLLEAMTASHLAELAARAVHLEASRDELGQRLRQVRRERFKLMHERVDVMVRELRSVRRSHHLRRPAVGRPRNYVW